MWYYIVAVPFILIGLFTRTYNLGDQGECFWIDHVSSGATCFTSATFTPALVQYGSLILGLALLYLGRRNTRRPDAQ